jgi:Tfp pilus assembly protein PilF
MRRAICLVVLGLLTFGTAAAQSNSPNAPVNVRGQLYAPDGSPLQLVVRLQLISDNPNRPPEYHYTNSHGAFVLPMLDPRVQYTIVVESDGKNWATTTESFMVTGPRSMVFITLRPHVTEKRSGKPSVSVSELQQNVPKAAKREYETALEHMEAGETEKARAMLERAIEIYPEYVAARNELAVALMRDGLLAAAEAQLRRALDVDNSAVRPLLNLGLCLYRQQKYTEAIPVLERAVQLQPFQPQGHLVLGFSLVMSGELERAEPVLRRAYEQGGKSTVRAQLYLSRLYTRWQQYEKAAQALEIYLTNTPELPDTPALQVTLEKLRAAATTKHP